MRCFREHPWMFPHLQMFWCGSLYQRLGIQELSADHKTLGEWLICAITDYWGHDGTLFMVALGIWDAKAEGERIFWRWDFWNAKMAPEARRWLDEASRGTVPLA